MKKGDMDFNKEVIEESKKRPVMVDFWAPWCGPCQFLGPSLEELEREALGKWKLVKVNTDENQELASQYGIRGIPDVRLFVDGASVAKFTGALPKHQVQQWLDKNLPDDREKELQTILASMNGSSAQLQEFVNRNPDMPSASLALAEKVLLENPELATQMLKGIPPVNENYQKAQNLIPLAQLLNFEKQENDIGALIFKAKESVLNADFETAIVSLIEAVRLEKSFYDELARKAAIALFNYLGDQNELTKKYRRQFDMALY